MKKQIAILLLVMQFISCKTDVDTVTIVSSVMYDNKYGFIDQQGKWVIRPSFDSVGTFYGGYADFYLNDKNGIINSKGEIIVQPVFDFIGLFNDSIALVLEGNEVNYINTEGLKVSDGNFEDGEDFSDGLAPIKFEKNGKWGYINTTGKLVIDTIYDYGTEFNNGSAEVEFGDSTFYIDRKGVAIDINQESIKPKSYKIIGDSNSGTLGRLNEKGDTIMKPQYISFGYEQDGLIWYNKEGLYGLANIKGDIIMKPKFQHLSYFSKNGLALAKLNNKFGYIDRKGNTIIDYKFDNAKGFKYDLAAVEVNKKWGFINRNNELVIEPKFKNVSSSFRNIYAKVDSGYEYKNE